MLSLLRWAVRGLATAAPSSSSTSLALPSASALAHARHRNIKVSPKKLNEIVRLVRGLSASEAIIQMQLCERRKSTVVQKCIQNAVNNAINNHGMALDRLFVKEAVVGRGQCTRMLMFHGRGRVGKRVKRRSHLTVKLAEQPFDPKERRIGSFGPTKSKMALTFRRLGVKRTL
ncbi:Large ribosomal subunit protein uL22m [Plasmodiophora brassicae]|uniref:50S ribosomal protein L22 n=1 Tax=Plasmodiophora brassicae TaxID=37360 RepID=A0A0G4J7K0_PLABS|nr:secrectory protein [Plasmodiophora brassicae]CEP03502.1 hypothetical protein PBRA_009387 [Plasmodiophora brassicae]SPQ99510.1 unnamed protein product [Plasmodiophora brassicae]